MSVLLFWGGGRVPSHLAIRAFTVTRACPLVDGLSTSPMNWIPTSRQHHGADRSADHPKQPHCARMQARPSRRQGSRGEKKAGRQEYYASLRASNHFACQKPASTAGYYQHAIRCADIHAQQGHLILSIRFPLAGACNILMTSSAPIRIHCGPSFAHYTSLLT